MLEEPTQQRARQLARQAASLRLESLAHRAQQVQPGPPDLQEPSVRQGPRDPQGPPGQPDPQVPLERQVLRDPQGLQAQQVEMHLRQLQRVTRNLRLAAQSMCSLRKTAGLLWGKRSTSEDQPLVEPRAATIMSSKSTARRHSESYLIMPEAPTPPRVRPSARHQALRPLASPVRREPRDPPDLRERLARPGPPDLQGQQDRLDPQGPQVPLEPQVLRAQRVRLGEMPSRPLRRVTRNLLLVAPSMCSSFKMLGRS